MPNLTIQEREQKEIQLKQHIQYAKGFIKYKLSEATPEQKQGDITFRFTEFANYLIDTIPTYKIEYEIVYKKLGKSYYLRSRHKRFEALLNQLIIKKYVSLFDVVQSTRNPAFLTNLYKIDVWDIDI